MDLPFAFDAGIKLNMLALEDTTQLFSVLPFNQH
jgi:hypothetical protein